MKKRLITGIVLVACLVGIFFLREISELFFDALLFAMILGSMYELCKAFSKIEIKCCHVDLLISVILFGAGYYLLGIKGVFYALVLSFIVLLVHFTFSHKVSVKDMFATLFTMVYPALFLYFAFEFNHQMNGLLLILLVMATSMFTDTFAYLVGSIVKGKKLCPTISPKKTISGAIGGFVGGVIGALLVYLCFEVWHVFGAQTLGFWKNPVVLYLIIGAIGAVFNEIGDLVSSQIKRKTGIKDFGHIFPGHGGVLDRIDGLLFVLFSAAIILEIFVVVL